jgi:hypothetical protein
MRCEPSYVSGWRGRPEQQCESRHCDCREARSHRGVRTSWAALDHLSNAQRWFGHRSKVYDPAAPALSKVEGMADNFTAGKCSPFESQQDWNNNLGPLIFDLLPSFSAMGA